MENFKIRSYGRTELAQLYSPELTPQAAYCRLSRWIDHYPGLRRSLADHGLAANARTYAPQQVQLIVEALGEP